MTAQHHRRCEGRQERCARIPECGLDCHWATAELPTQMLPDPPEWQNEPPEIDWSILAWALLLVAGAFGLVAVLL